MDVPPEIAFRNLDPTDALKRLVQEGIDSLAKVHPRVVSCRVMVEEASRGLPHVRLDIGIPGGELVVDHEAPLDPQHRDRDVAQAIREAFNVARRQLRERHKRRSDGKRRGGAPQGRILRLIMESPADRYGFLLSDDGREIYFHESVVRGIAYDEMVEGLEVSFTEASAKEGSQATSVSPLVGGDDMDSEERHSLILGSDAL